MAAMLVMLTLSIVVLATGSWIIWNNLNTNQKSSENLTIPITKVTSSAAPIPAKPTQIGVSTLWFGDVFWGRYVDDWSKASSLKTAYPFSGLATFEREKYDAWIADLECPISEKYVDSTTQDDTLSFSCPPPYTIEAAKWFTAFTLANNHTDNREDVGGFAFTQKILAENNIQHFGSFDNARKSDICEIVTLPAHAIFAPTTGELREKSTPAVPFALCGFHNVFKLPLADEIAVITEYAKYFPTIVMPHQGKEYTYVADDLQEAYARKYIDAGADAVIGDHVHSVQNSEAYKGKLIMYSVGNFIFDQQTTPQVTQAVGANLDFSFTNDAALTPYLVLASDCKIHSDTCLAQAQKAGFVKPSFTIKYDIVASDNSGKLAKKGTPALLEQLKKRLNWEQTLAGLVQSMGILFLTSSGLQSKKFREKMRMENRFVEKKVVLIPNAVHNYENDPQIINDIRYFKELEAQVYIQNISIRNVDFSIADVVYVSGGNTFELLNALRSTDFLSQIQAFLSRGGTYIGVSAGALILSPDIEVARDLQTDLNTIKMTDFTGFNIISEYIQVHSNWLGEPLVKRFEKRKNVSVVRLDNDSWIEKEV